jgi:hypothetical protein
MQSSPREKYLLKYICVALTDSLKDSFPGAIWNTKDVKNSMPTGGCTRFSGDKTPVIFGMCKKEKPSITLGKIITPNRRDAGSSNYSDDNQVSSRHPSFTDVMAKGRV